jgi:hypothetical protein
MPPFFAARRLGYGRAFSAIMIVGALLLGRGHGQHHRGVDYT